MPAPNVQWITPDDGQGSCPKHVDLCTRINLEISASVGFIKNIYNTMQRHMNVKISKCMFCLNSHSRTMRKTINICLFLQTALQILSLRIRDQP